MGLLDHLFGRNRPSDNRSSTPRASGPQPFEGGSATGTKRPVEIIAEATLAWQAKNAARAEQLFHRAIEAYKSRDTEDISFALGRYAAFLLEQGRTSDAERILEMAIDQKTVYPNVWSDYAALVATRHDIDSFKRAIERMAASVKHGVDPNFLLAHAKRADREGASDFAEGVARWVVERCERDCDNEGRFAAIGELGRVVERAGRSEEAVRLWRNAFDSGSTDPETAARLSMALEREKDYSEAIAVIREALTRGLPANVEETLRKRLGRCEDKLSGAGATKTKHHADVFAYSIRRESDLFEPLFQLRVKPALKDLELVGTTARCLLSSRDSSTIVDIDLVKGSESRRVENLPLLGDAWFTPDGRGIGIRRTAAIGKGPTLLRFLGADGRVLAESSVPDATSEIAWGGDFWYIGCRNGYLYAFGPDGKQRWSWQTPCAADLGQNGYFRPCPYYVTAGESFAVIASMGNIYAVSATGETLWHASLPNEKQTRWEFTVPVSGEAANANSDAFRTLGLVPGAPRSEVKSAYRRLALATHPDRNPDDNAAVEKFRTVQGAYERVLAGPATGTSVPAGITVSMEIQGLGPTASFLSASATGVVVGSSQGRLYVFDQKGKLVDARVLGDGPVRVALRSDGGLGAAWCSDALVFFRQNKIVNAAEALEWPRALTMLGENVVLWRGNDVQVMDPAGRLLFAVEFSKTVTDVVAHGDTLVCAAGVLAAFRRAGNEH